MSFQNVMAIHRIVVLLLCGWFYFFWLKLHFYWLKLPSLRTTCIFSDSIHVEHWIFQYLLLSSCLIVISVNSRSFNRSLRLTNHAVNLLSRLKISLHLNMQKKTQQMLDSLLWSRLWVMCFNYHSVSKVLRVQVSMVNTIRAPAIIGFCDKKSFFIAQLTKLFNLLGSFKRAERTFHSV